MAATRLIALHVNKGKTVAQCLADRTDYSQNAAKTNDGEFISSYECDPKTADEEFLLSKRQYQHITGRQQKNNIIAYQIRQSFKPGEITPEEANQVGYETAMRWTKGKHAFIVATHIDKSHIHNHIIYNSTSLDATRKFKNFFLSGLAVQRLSDMVCLEHGLSIITPKPYRERQKRTVYPKKRTQRDELCDAIDAVLKQKPKSFDGFVQALADMGFEFKDGKQPAFKGENQKRFIRLRSLGEGYSKEEIQAVISGKNLHKSKGGSAKAPAPKQFQMLIDIQAKMAEGKTVGYEKWAKKFNRKEAARTVILLKEKGLGNYDDLTAHIENLSARFDALSDSIKVAEKRMVEVQALQQHIKNYRNTRQIYIEYRKSGYEKPIFDVLQGLLIFGNVLVCHFLRPLERALAGFGHCVLVGHFLKSFLFLFQPFLVLVISPPLVVDCGMAVIIIFFGHPACAIVLADKGLSALLVLVAHNAIGIIRCGHDRFLLCRIGNRCV